MTIYRLQRARENICPSCVESLRRTERTCFVCGRKYSEAGPSSSSPEEIEAFKELIRPRRSPEDEEKRLEEWRRRQEEMGRTVREEPVPVSEWKEFKQKLLAGRV